MANAQLVNIWRQALAVGHRSPRRHETGHFAVGHRPRRRNSKTPPSRLAKAQLVTLRRRPTLRFGQRPMRQTVKTRPSRLASAQLSKFEGDPLAAHLGETLRSTHATGQRPTTPQNLKTTLSRLANAQAVKTLRRPSRGRPTPNAPKFEDDPVALGQRPTRQNVDTPPSRLANAQLVKS